MTEALEEKLGHSFRNISLLKSALHHSSIKSRALQFERLEFLGDRILGTVIAEFIFSKFNVDEGTMAKMFSAFVCADSCKLVALKLGLDEHLVTAGNHLRTNETVLADAMESVLGAVFIDGGYDSAKAVIIRCWDEVFNCYDDVNYDPKTKLQEVCQRETGAAPQYEVLSVTGQDHNPTFTVSASIGNERVVANGTSRKKAETLAARLLLQKLSEQEF
jgi:ribonuclease-3